MVFCRRQEKTTDRYGIRKRISRRLHVDRRSHFRLRVFSSNRSFSVRVLRVDRLHHHLDRQHDQDRLVSIEEKEFQ